MNQNAQYDISASRRAFHQGMMMALGVALAPLGLVALALFLSGRQITDFDTSIRYALLAAWVVFLVSLDRLTKLRMFMRFNWIKPEQRGQILTILALSVFFPALRLDPSMSLVEMGKSWGSGFILLLAVLLCLYSLASLVHGSWQRIKARKRAMRDHPRRN